MFLKNIDVGVFDDVLQNAKHLANNASNDVNRPPLQPGRFQSKDKSKWLAVMGRLKEPVHTWAQVVTKAKLFKYSWIVMYLIGNTSLHYYYLLVLPLCRKKNTAKLPQWTPVLGHFFPLHCQWQSSLTGRGRDQDCDFWPRSPTRPSCYLSASQLSFPWFEINGWWLNWKKCKDN